MKNNRLFILGNGFDLSHGLGTKWQDFYGWLSTEYKKPCHCAVRKSQAKVAYEFISDLIRQGLEINHFEEQVGNYVCSSSDEIEKYRLALNVSFAKWIFETVDYTNIKDLFEFCETDLFITFNFTRLLEEVYKVNDERICHIHGDAERERANYLFFENSDLKLGGEILDKTTTWGMDQILTKDTKQIYESTTKIKNFLSKTSEVHIFGSCLSNVDFYYFERIAKELSANKIPIYIYCYDSASSDEKERVCEGANKLGKYNKNIETVPSSWLIKKGKIK